MRPDDPTILDDVHLYRLVTEEHYDWSDADQEWIMRSGLFDNSSDGDGDEMSVVLGDTLANANRPPEDIRGVGIGVGVAMITARYARAESQSVARDPDLDSDDPEPAHGVVCGTKAPKKRKRFRDNAVWIVLPFPDGRV
jgi:hypothetical protein